MITSGSVDLGGGLIDSPLGKSPCNFARITSGSVDPGGAQLTVNLGSHFATLQGVPVGVLILGGQLTVNLGQSLCNFSRITSGSADPAGGVLIDSQLREGSTKT